MGRTSAAGVLGETPGGEAVDGGHDEVGAVEILRASNNRGFRDKVVDESRTSDEHEPRFFDLYRVIPAQRMPNAIRIASPTIQAVERLAERRMELIQAQVLERVTKGCVRLSSNPFTNRFDRRYCLFDGVSVIRVFTIRQVTEALTNVDCSGGVNAGQSGGRFHVRDFLRTGKRRNPVANEAICRAFTLQRGIAVSAKLGVAHTTRARGVGISPIGWYELHKVVNVVPLTIIKRLPNHSQGITPSRGDIVDRIAEP